MSDVVKFTRVEAEALADMVYYATQNCFLEEDVLMYQSLAEKLDKVIVVDRVCEHSEYRRLDCGDCYLNGEQCEEIVCVDCGASKEEL
jgi:hypothetical protein